jgi:hypothetical protein
MQLPDRFREGDLRRRLAPTAPLSCERGGPVQKIDQLLEELLYQYRERFPEFRLAVVQTGDSAD